MQADEYTPVIHFGAVGYVSQSMAVTDIQENLLLLDHEGVPLSLIHILCAHTKRKFCPDFYPAVGKRILRIQPGRSVLFGIPLICK